MWIARMEVEHDPSEWIIHTYFNEYAFDEALYPGSLETTVAHTRAPGGRLLDFDRLRRRLSIQADCIGLLLRPGAVRFDLDRVAPMPPGDDYLQPS